MVGDLLLNKRAVLLILMLSFFNIASVFANSSELILFIDKSESTLGRPIRAELYGVSLKTKITDINLSPLYKNFGLVEDYVINHTSDKRWPDQSVQILKFKLYPRHTGTIVIPHLISAEAKTSKKTINISTDKTGVPKIFFSTAEPYERQQITVHVTVSSNESTSRLSIKEDFNIKGFTSNQLPFIRKKEKNGQYSNKIGWALSAIKSGKQKLKLPAVEYSVSGVLRKQFYLPLKVINIKPLPSYLPPTIPVGKVTIKSQVSSNSILQTNAINYWKLKINGNVSDSYRLPAILRQIKSNENIKILPVNSKRSKNITGESYISDVNYTIPFKALNSGFVKLPEITIQYFDPNNGKINTFIYQAPSLYSLGTFWRSIISIFVLTCLSYVSFIGYKKLMELKLSFIKRRQALQVLKGAIDIGEIKQSIRLFSEAEKWPKNIPLNQWYIFWLENYKVKKEFIELIPRLSSAFYSSNKNKNVSALSSQLYELIAQRKRL